MVDGIERGGVVKGAMFTGHGRPSPTFGRGRVCQEQGCETHLSIYNDSRYCYLHDRPVTPRMRGRKIA